MNNSPSAENKDNSTAADSKMVVKKGSGSSSHLVSGNPWTELRRHTTARIALGRCGSGIPTGALLEFKLGHAAARDAVHVPLDFGALQDSVRKITDLPILHLRSAAGSRAEYLQRPDLGAQLQADAAAQLKDFEAAEGYDLALVVADGLSARAIAENLTPLLEILLPKFAAAQLRLAPLCLIEQGRVAVGDHIAEALGARLTLVCIGERPGLQSHNSMGIYLTYGARVGAGNDSRNCISNVRPQGLSVAAAADKILYLAAEALRRGVSGIELKDDQPGVSQFGEAQQGLGS